MKLTDKDIYDGIELLTEEDVRSILREIIHQIRDKQLYQLTPRRIYIPSKLWKILENYNKSRE